MSNAKKIPYIQNWEVSRLLSLGVCAICWQIGCDAGAVSGCVMQPKSEPGLLGFRHTHDPALPAR